ncbi:MAG: hypothetical protein SF123_02155 [Chloroflexota bacterium]|nr:hypothetical protein [Chloroflexota bacterium]
MIPIRLLLLAVCLLLVNTACAPQPAAPETPAVTIQSLPIDDVTSAPSTATPDPLLATMAQVTIPPLTLYESARFGYSFRYPVTSGIEVSNEGEIVWIDAQIMISVSAANPEQAQGSGTVIETAESTSINGIAARRLTGSIGSIGGNTPQHYQSIVIARNNRYYVLTAYELRRDVVLPVDRTLEPIPLPVQSVFDTIVATFTFIG